MDPLPPDIAAQDKGPGILATVVVVTVLSTLFCAARIYTRGRILGRLQLDDYLIVLAVVFAWASVAFTVMAVRSGNGKHFALLSPAQRSAAILWTMVGFCPGILSFAVPKLAVVVLLTRLLNPGRRHRVFLWGLVALCSVSLIACVPVLFGRCTPSRALWDLSVPPDACFSPWVLVFFAMYAGSLSAFTDLYLAVYPAMVLFSLQMNMRKKVALSTALGIGSIATVVAVYKTTRLPSLATDDFSYNTSDLVVWTAVEGATINIAACIPVLQPFVDRIVISGLFGSRTGRSSRNGVRGYDHCASGVDAAPGAPTSSSKLRAAAAIELASQRGLQHRRRPVKDPNGLTFLDETRAGSEESILQVKLEPRQAEAEAEAGLVRGAAGPVGPGGPTGGGRHGQLDAVAEAKCETEERGSVGEEGESVLGPGEGPEDSQVTPAGGIVRTHEVSVEFGHGHGPESVQNLKNGGRWNSAWEPAAPGSAV